MRLKVIYHTDVGRKRKNNEDSLCVVKAQLKFGVEKTLQIERWIVKGELPNEKLENGKTEVKNLSEKQMEGIKNALGIPREQKTDITFWILGIADGMGGHMAGEVASGIAVDRYPEAVLNELLKGVSVGMAAENGLKEINKEILKIANENIWRYGNMGTTFCAMIVIERADNNCIVVNVGDSRAYLFRDNTLKQLTRDHTYVNVLLEDGVITKEMAFNHPQRNVLLRAVGIKEKVFYDRHEIVLKKGDMFLLCSDGLTDAVPDEEIREIFLTTPFPNLHHTLIERANYHGGKDNITVVIARVD